MHVNAYLAEFGAELMEAIQAKLRSGMSGYVKLSLFTNEDIRRMRGLEDNPPVMRRVLGRTCCLLTLTVWRVCACVCVCVCFPLSSWSPFFPVFWLCVRAPCSILLT